jgi:hypothetical protein
MSRVTFPERRPYVFVLLVELLVVVVYLGAGTAEHFLKLGGMGVYAIANAALTVLLALLVTRLGWWQRIGFRRASAASLLWVLPMLVPVVLNFLPGLKPGGIAEVAAFLALALMVGFVEEVVFRGLMLRALEPRGVWPAALITTVLFSTTHLMNVMAGEGGLQAVLQVFYSAAIGFAFTALVLRTGAIWPLIIAHALIDFVAFMQDPAFVMAPAMEITLDLGVTVFFVAYGLFVMSRRATPAPAADASSPTSSSAV